MNAKSPIGFQTEIDFELPKGYVDDAGTPAPAGRDAPRHRGRRDFCRCAIHACSKTKAYLAVIVLARASSMRLGNLPEVHTGIIEGLYASDLAYLQRLYEQLNSDDDVDSHRVTGTSAISSGSSLHRATALGEA